MFIKKLLPLTLIAVMAGCSSVARVTTDDYNLSNQVKRPAKSVKVFSTDLADREYVVIGEVVASADAGSDAKRSVDLLKKQAGELGADAIINLKLAVDYGYWLSAIKATGTAVSFKEVK